MLIVKTQNGVIIQVYGVEKYDHDDTNDEADEDYEELGSKSYIIYGILDTVKPVRMIIGEYSTLTARDMVFDGIEEYLNPFIIPDDIEFE